MNLCLTMSSVLTPFNTATKHLSTDKEFSLHMVVATKHKLMKELLVLETEGAIIRGFKEHLKVMLDRYFSLNETHKMATLLDPKFKKIVTKLLTEQDIKDALNNLNSMVDDLPLARPAPTGERYPTEPPAKKTENTQRQLK